MSAADGHEPLHERDAFLVRHCCIGDHATECRSACVRHHFEQRTGIEEQRARLAHAFERTREVLQPSDAVWQRWQRWLQAEALWPQHLALVHGDLHPGHTLVLPKEHHKNLFYVPEPLAARTFAASRKLRPALKLPRYRQARKSRLASRRVSSKTD